MADSAGTPHRRRRRSPDVELTLVNRMLHQLAALAPDARRRVLAYLADRERELPQEPFVPLDGAAHTPDAEAPPVIRLAGRG